LRSCRRPSAPFSWESLHRPATGSDVLCRPLARPRVLLTRHPSLTASRSRRRAKPERQVRSWHAPVRAMHRSRTRTPSTSSTSPDSEDSRVGPNMIESPIATGAPVRAPKEPALSRGWVPAARYSFPPDDTEMSPLVYERMPLPGLCSRLVVTSTRWTALLPSLGLSPFRPPQPASPFRPSLRPSFQNATVHGDADRPLPAFSALGGDAVDAAPPAAATHIAPKGYPVSRALARWGHCPPLTSPMG
jgi:hypothetical protein